MRSVPQSRLQKSLFDLALIFTGYAVAIFPYSDFLRGGLQLSEMLSAAAVSAITFWIVIQFHDAGSEGFLVSFLERFCLGTGANLLLHSLLTYAFLVRRTPFLIAVGSLFAAALLTLERRWISGRETQGSRVLMIGFDSIAERIAQSLRRPVLGVVGPEGASLPANVPYLGPLDSFGNILREFRPTHVVIGMEDWDTRLAPSMLLQCRLGGTVVEDTPGLYERLFRRISCQRLQPMDLLLSSALRGDSRTMAIQAVYSNLIALFLLLATTPLLLLLTIAVAVSSGPGPVFDSIDCAGLRYIPFRLLRFRTHRLDGSANMTAIGRLLIRSHLVDLPQLINVVRGEMAMVGPRPVRREFAYYLTERMPFFSHRVSVKPGMFGWAQMHVPNTALPADECLQVEYDLYYIKRGSPWLDGQILVSTVLPGKEGANPSSGEREVASVGVC